MAVFSYRAKNLVGGQITGAAEAASPQALEDLLREQGYFVVESKKKLSAPKPLTGGLFQRRVKPRDMAVFCRQFSVLLNAGVTVVEAVSILKKQTESRALAEALAEVHQQLRRGSLLSQAAEAQQGLFGEFFCNMVRVGEASGALDTVTTRLADYYERENKVSQKVRSAMTYPAILGVLTVGVIFLIMVWVLPMFSGILNQMGGSLPGLTVGLMAVSDFFAQNFLALLVALAALYVFFLYFKRSEAGRLFFDRLKLNLPGMRQLTVKIVTARFARSMSILLKSGVPVINAVDLMKRMVGNRVIEKKFEALGDAIREGRGIAGPIQEMGLFPGLLVHMIAVGESSGELDEMLSRTASFFDLEVEEGVDRLTVMIEPILIIVLGAVVGLVIGSIMLPMIGVMTAL